MPTTMSSSTGNSPGGYREEGANAETSNGQGEGVSEKTLQTLVDGTEQLQAETERISGAVDDLEGLTEQVDGLERDVEDKRGDLEELEQQVSNKINLLDQRLGEMETRINEMKALKRELETCEASLEQLFGNLAQETEGKVTGVVEDGKDELTGLTEDLLRPLRAVYFAIEDHLKEAAGEVETLAEEQEEKYQKMARASAEVKTVSEGLEEKSAELSQEVKAIKKMRKSMEVEVDKARTTAEILREVAVEEDIERLSDIAEWGIDRMIRRGMEVRKKMLEGVENQMAEILNRLDERKKEVAHRLDSSQRFMKQILGEAKAVRVGVEEVEQRIDKQIKQLVRETKAITLRRAALIGGVVFFAMVLSVVFMRLVGLL